MGEVYSKVGIISCSGEEISEGTVARQAVRRVLEALRPQQTVTLCLPLFLAGEVGERRFAREHHTITVDGCSKLCAKRGTEKYSGEVSASLVVSDIIGERAKCCHRSIRKADKTDEEAVWLVAERIASEVDALVNSARPPETSGESAGDDGACCACSRPSQEGKLEVCGQAVAIAGLPLIFQHLWKKGLQPCGDFANTVLETVKIYHAIEANDEADYRNALGEAYKSFCERQI